jgi:hypothetical protein
MKKISRKPFGVFCMDHGLWPWGHANRRCFTAAFSFIPYQGANKSHAFYAWLFTVVQIDFWGFYRED